jgi:hypothetical protein
MSGKYESHWLERQDRGPVTVVRLKTPGLVDEDTVRPAFDPISALVGEVGRSKLVLNLAAVESLSRPVLAKPVLLNRKAQAAQGRLALGHLSPAVGQSLAGTDVATLFNVYATEQEAVQSFSSEEPPGLLDLPAAVPEEAAPLPVLVVGRQPGRPGVGLLQLPGAERADLPGLRRQVVQFSPGRRPGRGPGPGAAGGLACRRAACPVDIAAALARPVGAGHLPAALHLFGEPLR